MATTQRVVRIGDDMWHAFQALCGRLGVSASERIRTHIEDDLHDDAGEGSEEA